MKLSARVWAPPAAASGAAEGTGAAEGADGMGGAPAGAAPAGAAGESGRVRQPLRRGRGATPRKRGAGKASGDSRRTPLSYLALPSPVPARPGQAKRNGPRASPPPTSQNPDCRTASRSSPPNGRQRGHRDNLPGKTLGGDGVGTAMGTPTLPLPLFSRLLLRLLGWLPPLLPLLLGDRAGVSARTGRPEVLQRARLHRGTRER